MAKQSNKREINGVVIESDVPFPEFHSSYRAWPFAEMAVGDSFAVASGDLDKVRTAASYAGTRGGHGKFSVRKTHGSGSPYRCWRIG